MPKKRAFKAFIEGARGRVAGKIDRRAKLFWHGEPFEDGKINLVGPVRAKLGRHSWPVVEKRFFRDFEDPEADFNVLKLLKERGANVIPTFRLATTRNEEGKLEKSLLLTDLSVRGKREVYSSNVFFNSEKAHKLISGLKNYPELRRRMEMDNEIAASLGFGHNGDIWVFSVDRKNNVGQVYLTDVGGFFLPKAFFEEHDARELKRAGIGSEEIRGKARELRAIQRKSARPLRFSVGELSRKMGKFAPQFRAAAARAIEANRAQFGAISRAYAEAFGIAMRHQIGGVANERESLGLTKAQRKALFEEMRKRKGDEFFRELFGGGEGKRWLAKRMFPEAEPRFVHVIRKETKRSQWDAVKIGQYSAEIIAREGRRLGKPIFAFDKGNAERFEGLAERVSRANSAAEAERVLEGSEGVIASRLVQLIYENLRRDLGITARARLKKDLPPFESPEWGRKWAGRAKP